MIDFNEIYTQAVVLFDDPDIKEAYDNNKIMFAKIMYPYLLSSYSNFQNPSIIGMQLSDMQEPDGKQELFKANGIDKKFISEIPYKDNSLYCYYENGKKVNGTYDYNENIVEFENILLSNICDVCLVILLSNNSNFLVKNDDGLSISKAKKELIEDET